MRAGPQVGPQVVEQVVAHRRERRVVPPVDLLERVVGEVVELALGAVVDGARQVGGAHPAVAGDRAQVDADAEQLAVPLGEHPLEATASASASSTGRAWPSIHRLAREAGDVRRTSAPGRRGPRVR